MRFLIAIIAQRTRKDSKRTTRANVSVKSTPAICRKPLSTSRALNLSSSPFDLYLHFHTHLHPSDFLPFGRVVRVQVSFSISELYSACVPLIHSLLSGRDTISLYVFGSLKRLRLIIEVFI